MCITREPAHLSNTIIYAAEANHPQHGDVHVIGYQNEVQNSSGGPNAMILPIPAVEPLGPENIIDTQGFRDVLKHYDKAVERMKPSLSRGLRTRGGSYGAATSKGFQIIESGSYTVVVAEKASGMRHGLDQVPKNKRPDIPASFMDALTKYYKDWPFAICCFDGDLGNPEPLLWWFKPLFMSNLFAPAIDAHDGNPPNVDVKVDRDHTVVFASYNASNRAVEQSLLRDLQSVPAEHSWMFLANIVGKQIRERTGNGDFILPIGAINDLKVPSYLPDLDVVPPPVLPPTMWERLRAPTS